MPHSKREQAKISQLRGRTSLAAAAVLLAVALTPAPALLLLVPLVPLPPALLLRLPPPQPWFG